MTLETSLDHLTAIALPTPFPVGPITVYLAHMPGEPLTLIDTGPRTTETSATLEAALEGLGFAANDLERIIVTHAHVDHYGLAADLVALSGARVASHAWNIPSIGALADDREERVIFYRSLFEQAGVPAGIVTAIREAIAGTRFYGRGTTVDVTLDEGDSLQLAGRDWRVLHTPGHAGGLICLYEPVSRTLLSSDHLLADISSNPVVEPPPPGHSERLKSLIAYMASLQRVASMDVERALPSHGPVIQDVPGLISRRQLFHRRRSARVLDCLGNGVATTWDVTQALFSKFEAMDTFLAISEVIGHLELLESAGKVAREKLQRVVLWSIVPGGVP